MKRCGLYIRVSTDRQVKVEEGSLKNQDQLLTQHVELKSKIGSEPWVIVDRYVDEGKSAKDIKGRPAYLRMVEDIKRDRIDTIICTALSRISRSTRDLLDMIDFFKQHEVDFICLKEDFDTTTAQGKCFVTIMGALNEFEREQTSERTRAAFLARAERGLWNGGHLIGYDLDPQRKGYLRPNQQEVTIVNFAFDTYLKTGSVLRTRDALNAAGFRTKAYTSRRGKTRAPALFTHGGVYQLLTNHAYIGKKEINKKIRKHPQDKLPEELRYRLVDAVWPAIVPVEKFSEVQRLLQHNFASRNNNASPTKHFYLLNGGLLYCHRCGGVMEGRNGHGCRGRKIYYYYVCKNRACRFKLPQAEIERICAATIATASQHDGVLPRVITKVNLRFKTRLPRLEADRRRLEAELRQVNAEAKGLLARAESINGGRIFVEERLKELADQRRQVEAQLERIRVEMAELNHKEVTETDVHRLLQECQAVFGEDMKPYQRRRLLWRAMQRIELSDTICRTGLKLSPALLSSDRSTGEDTFSHLPWGASLVSATTSCSGCLCRSQSERSGPVTRRSA